MPKKALEGFIKVIIIKKNGYGVRLLIRPASYAKYHNQLYGQFGRYMNENFFNNLKAVIFETKKDVIQAGFERFLNNDNGVFLLDEYKTTHEKIKFSAPPKQTSQTTEIETDDLTLNQKVRRLDPVEKQGYIRTKVIIIARNTRTYPTKTIYLLPSTTKAKSDTSIKGLNKHLEPVEYPQVQGIGFVSIRRAKEAGYGHFISRKVSNVFIDPHL
jgi:hypothetical protein